MGCDLGVLHLVDGDDFAERLIEDDEAGGGGALVDGGVISG